MTTPVEELADWASGLRLDDVPDRVVAIATSQVLSQLAAARAGLSHPLGARLVEAYGRPFQADAARSAQVLAGLTSWLHLDDTAYAGHLSNSTVTVPLAYAHRLGLSGRDLLTAVVAANECAARIAAAATLGRFRGQNAAHTHLAGAVAGRLRSENAPAGVWADALALAFAMPPWPSLRAFLGSDAKLLSAAMPVRAGLDACDAAHAGLRGPRDVLDEFLTTYASVPLPDAVTLGLGTRWHTETLSFKLHPGGPGLDAAVDCALDLHAEYGSITADDVDEVTVETSMYTLLVDQKAAEFVDRERTPVSALVFCTPYAVATALLTGTLTPADFAAPNTGQDARWRLAAKVRLEHDEAMTRASLLSTAPFGEAIRQAGPRAATWLAEVGTQWLVDLVGQPGPPQPSFEHASKATPARVTVRLTGEGPRTRELWIPAGAVGHPDFGRHAELVRTKWAGVGGAPEIADTVLGLPSASAPALRAALDAAFDAGLPDPPARMIR